MFRHADGCKGPPCTCSNTAYWVLTSIALFASFLEWFFAWHFAGSSSAQADAFHATSHGLLYYIAIRINIKTGQKNITQEELCHIQEKHLNWGWRILLFSLIYVVFMEAIPQIWRPTTVASGFMLTGVVIGLSGNIISRYILKKMRPIFSSGKNAHEGEYHKVLIWDNLLDLSISAIVLVAAIAFWFTPTNILINYGYLLYRIDPVLTLVIVPVIGWRGYEIFKKGTTHDH